MSLGERFRDHLRRDVPLAGLTTLGVGGPARLLLESRSAEETAKAVAEADARGVPLLLLGSGSNLLVGDQGWDGLVLRSVDRGGGETVDEDGSVRLRFGAGHDWDELVARAVASGWSGIEALSGIPGSLGAAPVQNIGAYGQELVEVVEAVEVYDRERGERRSLAAAECGFAYRHSLFKETERYVLLSVSLRLRRDPLSAPLRYAELAGALDLPLGARAPLAEVRAAVLGLRRRKGMVLDADDPDTRSAGSFFMNPVLDAETAAALPVAAPRWPQADGRVKTSAAWLIEQAGFGKGYSGGRAHVSVSTKHTLALTNRGGATAGELIDLAREVRAGVQARFGLCLVPEPRLVNDAI